MSNTTQKHLHRDKQRSIVDGWSPNFEYNVGNVKKHAVGHAGNYVLRVVQNNGYMRIVYVGNAKNLQAGLLHHLSGTKNKNLKLHMNDHMLFFQCREAETKEERNGVERNLLQKYSPECNQSMPVSAA
ncbi:MAG: GIY-YIG nuclease family protein [Nitrosopumilus sp. H8]|nr:MAG: GIY-YIG nuclease family protein [Nitrosopumilus sp. H8]